MTWEKYVFPYFPPLFAIYLLFSSDVVKAVLRRQVDQAADRGVWGDRANFAYNWCAGWASKVSFFSSMFAASFSLFSIYASSQSYAGVVIALAILLPILFRMMWFLQQYEPDEIEVLSWRRNWTPAKLCKWVLVGVNVGLMLAILANQLIVAHRDRAKEDDQTGNWRKWKPPSTLTTSPVQNGSAPVTSAATARPTSSAVPQRRIGVSPSAISAVYLSRTAEVMSVSMMPGRTS